MGWTRHIDVERWVGVLVNLTHGLDATHYNEEVPELAGQRRQLLETVEDCYSGLDMYNNNIIIIM